MYLNHVAEARSRKFLVSRDAIFPLFCTAKTFFTNMKKITLLLGLLCCVHWAAAQRHTVSGYVTDAASGEKLIGARVFDPTQKIGALTNAYGYYALSTQSDTLQLLCSYVGFKTSKMLLVLSADQDSLVNIGMEPEGTELATVVITDEADIAESSQMSTIDVPIETIKKIPALFGEVDIIRAIQLLPGVKAGNEGSTGMYVRGGGPDQNLILLDGVPVYNVSHLFGFFSIFPADAISNVNLIKGGFPARYGGRLSSVLDISLKEGNNKDFHGEIGVGIISSKLTLEGPIWKDKTSFMVSGRRTYIDALARPIIKASGDGNTVAGYYFYDMVGKVNHKFNDRDRVFLSFYGGRDRFYLRAKEEESRGQDSYFSEFKSDLAWGNLIGAARWNHLFNNKLFANVTATYSSFDFGIGTGQTNEETVGGLTERSRFVLGYNSGIRDLSGRIDFDWFATPAHMVRFGGYGTSHTFTPGVTEFVQEFSGFKVDTVFGAQVVNAFEAGAYIEDDFKLNERHRLNLGLHGSTFVVQGKPYWSLQPRAAHRMLLGSNWAVKSSFASMAQYVHLLTNVSVGLPTDLWVPTTEQIAPQRAYQGAVGVARSFRDQGLELTVEGYYKAMTGLIEYKEGASFLSNSSDWQTLVAQGDGAAYGMEVLLQRKAGKTNGWIGYTLAWTNRTFAELNGGKTFPFKYDRRHDLSLVVTHKFSDRIDCGLTWIYGTGNAVTLPIASYQGVLPQIGQQYGLGYDTDLVVARNDYRMRATHRLDLGINFHKKMKHWDRTWSFSAYNAYSRRNPFFLYWGSEPFTGKRQLKQVSLFPILPSVSYHIKF
jgi:hypothetical protein